MAGSLSRRSEKRTESVQQDIIEGGQILPGDRTVGKSAGTGNLRSEGVVLTGPVGGFEANADVLLFLRNPGDHPSGGTEVKRQALGFQGCVRLGERESIFRHRIVQAAQFPGRPLPGEGLGEGQGLHPFHLGCP